MLCRVYGGPMSELCRTQNLVLRKFNARDVDNLVDLDSDPDVMFFITGGRATPRAEIADQILPWFIDHDGYWAAEHRGTAEFLGWFHLRPAEGHEVDELELGYRLRRSAWGHGYAAEGSRALIDLAFATFGATCVVAETMVVHSASRRVMEKSGMRLVREFRADWPDRIPGDEHGDVEYAITREEWSGRQR